LKSIPRRGWTWDVGSFTGQIATLVEEDRYGDRIWREGLSAASLLVANWPPACIRIDATNEDY
jgi:hypothetical protein